MSYYIIGKYINARLSVNYTERMETAKAGPGPTFAGPIQHFGTYNLTILRLKADVM